MKKCSVCGKELPESWAGEKCLDCSRKAMQKIFKENPEVKQAFMETIQELQKPENIERMARDTANFMNTIQQLKAKGK